MSSAKMAAILSTGRWVKDFIIDVFSKNGITCKDHFVYAPSQWDTTLHYNVVSNWRGAYTKWSLGMTY